MKIKIKIKCSGGLPGLEDDEMSKGNTRYKESQEWVVFQKPREGSILRRRKRE